MEEKIKVIDAMATYTGGGINIYTGQLETGEFYMFDNCTEIDAVTLLDRLGWDDDEMFYDGFDEQHGIRTLIGKAARRLIEDTLRWIIKKEPRGNYSVTEVEDDLNEFYMEWTGSARSRTDYEVIETVMKNKDMDDDTKVKVIKLYLLKWIDASDIIGGR